MSISNTSVSQTYAGNGSQLLFPITFDYFENSQVKVKRLNTLTSTEEFLVEGTDYTVVSPNISMMTAPASTEEITVYRETPKTQEIDYIETGAFKAEDHEKGMDRMVMMIQELGGQVSSVVTTPVSGSGAFARLNSQAVIAGGTVNIGTNQRLIKVVSGDTGGTTADTTTPIQDGVVDGQELRLVGGDNIDTLTILNQGNVDLNGDIVFHKNTILDLFWDQANTEWVEQSRRS